jgi:predicted nucleotidyltransferase
MSQTELARRAGVSQPVISAYEAGHREPGLEMLRKLTGASGHDLVVELAPQERLVRGLPDTPAGRRLRRHRRAMIKTAASLGARNLRVFGSVARGDDTEASDVDLLVDLDAGVGLVNLIRLEQAMAAMLGTEVDVVPASGLKPALRDDVHAEAIPL